MMKNASLKKAGIFSLAGLVIIALIILSFSVLSEDAILGSELPPLIEERPIKLPHFNLEVPTTAGSSGIAAPAGMRTMALSESEPLLETQRVVVILKDPLEVEGWEEAASYDEAELVSLKNVMRDYVIQRELDDSDIRNKFTTFNGFSAELTSEEIDALEQNPLIQEVFEDGLAQTLLDDTTVLTGATDVWGHQLYGLNITGQGVGVCILDTGLNYSHEAFDTSGDCELTITTPRTDTIDDVFSENFPGEYPNNYYERWEVTLVGYTSISLHFANMDVEEFYDYIYIYDENETLVYTLTGINNDFWTPEIDGDTAIVEMTSDDIITSTGFLIDEAKNGTGVNWDSCERVLGGYDFVNGDPDPIDDNLADGGHGTHVAGIVGANSSTVKGIAPESNLIPVKVADDSGSAYFSDIVAGIEYCTKNKDRYGISVISISIGTEEPYLFDGYCDDDPGSSMFSGPIDAATAAGISVVVAAGNDADSTHISSPACIESAIPVASSTKADEISSFSNRNDLVQLTAPGGGGGDDIDSTTLDGYGTMAGTSMAVPHVSGAIALLTQYLNQRELTMEPSEFESLLNSTGTTIVDSDTSLEYRRIDIYAALQGIMNEAPIISTVRISPLLPDTESDLSCYVNATDTQDPVLEANWSWYKDGAEMFHGSQNVLAGTNALVATLGNANTTKGEVWNCTVSVSDGIDTSAVPNSNQTTIGNSIPILQSSNITVNQSLYYPNSILGGWCNATDADPIDNVTYSWKWFRNGALNLSGNEINYSICYQESADEATACGGLDTGEYANEGYTIENYTMIHDGNPYTGGNSSTIGVLYYVNYTKPENALNSSQWVTIVTGGSTTISTININCWNQPVLMFRSNITNPSPSNYYLEFECYNGSVWVPSRDFSSAFIEGLSFNEEYMLWNISNTTYHHPGTSVNVANLTSSLSAGQNWTLECTAYDGTDYSSSLNSTKIQIAEYNVVPNITSLSISPASPTSLSNLVCYATATDQESEILAVNWSWYQNGVKRFNGTTNVQSGINTPIAQLGAANTSKGDVWNCTATAFDLLDYSALNSTLVAIQNEAPELESAGITTDTSVPEPDSILLGWCNATDVDGDTLTYNWSWLQNGEEYLSGTTLGSLCFQEDATDYETCGAIGTGAYAHNDESNDGNWDTFSDHGDYYINYTKPIDALRATTYWQVKTFDDGEGWVITDNLTIPLSCWDRPVLQLLSYVSLGSNYMSCYDGASWINLTSTYTGTCIFDCVLFEEAIRWNISTTSFEEGTNSNVANLSIGFAVGEEWSFECTADDGTDSSESLESATITIQEGNTEPEILSFVVGPALANSDNDLLCNITIYDPNLADELEAEWAWYKGGEEMFSGTADVLNGTNTLISTLGAANTTPGEVWNCTARAFDGWDYSAYSSQEIEILNRLPSLSESTISSTPSGFPDIGILLGRCNADDEDQQSIQYSWKWFRNGMLNSSGSEVQPFSCYQESMDEATSCGGLGTGSYECSGDWDGTNGCANTIDGDWGTYGGIGLPSNHSIIYLNYTKPDGALNNSMWQLYDMLGTTNYSIPAGCWDYDPERLIFKVETILIGTPPLTLTMTNWSCFDGGWDSLAYESINLYEEAMWWNISREHQPGELANLSTILTGLSAGQNWTFECTAFDGINYSATLNSTLITIVGAEGENWAPTIEELALVPAAAYPSDNLYCNATAADLENVSLDVEWAWYKEGIEMFSGTTPINADENTLIATLGAGNLSVGEIWNCTVRSFDGENYSAYSSAASRMYSSENILTLGEQVSSAYPLYTEGELPFLLTDWDYINDGDDESGISASEQRLYFEEEPIITFLEDNDFDPDYPYVMMHSAPSGLFMTYELNFTPGIESDFYADDTCGDPNELCDIEETMVNFLGKDYWVNKAEWNGINLTWEMMTGNMSATMEENETSTYTVYGLEYEVTVDNISATDNSVFLTVNGVQTRELEEGDTTKVSGIHVAIRQISIDVLNEEGNLTEIVQFYLGAEKIALFDSDVAAIARDGEVIVGTEAKDDLFSDIVGENTTNSRFSISSIMLSWVPEESLFIVEGDSVQFPINETFEVSLDDFISSDTPEEVSFTPQADGTVRLRTTLQDGEIVLSLLHSDAAVYDSFGDSSTPGEGVILVSPGTITKGDYILLSSWSDRETHVLELTDIDSSNQTFFEDLVTGAMYDEACTAGCTFLVGSTGIVIGSVDTMSNTAVIDATSDVSHYIYTSQGLTIDIGETVSGEPTHNITLIEEDESGFLAAGYEFTVVLGHDAGDTIIGNILSEEAFEIGPTPGTHFYEDADTDVFSTMTRGGTLVIWNMSSNQGPVELEYPGMVSYAEISIIPSEDIVDNTAPSIALSRITSYPSGYYYTGKLLGWCNATDSDGDNVTYSWKWFRNGILNSSGSEAFEYPAGSSINLANITTGLAVGQVWRFECTADDAYGTSAAVNSSAITIRSPSSGGGGSSGGGAVSFSTFWTTTYSIDRAKLINGTIQSLGARQRMKLTQDDGELLYVGVVSVTSTSATLNLTGEYKEQVLLYVGDTYKYDADKDGTYDLLITFSQLLQSKAYLYVQEINEPVEAAPSPEPELPEEEEVPEVEVIVRPPEQPAQLPDDTQDEIDRPSLTNNLRPIILAMVILLIVVVPAFIFIITRASRGGPHLPISQEAGLKKPASELERLGGYNSKLPDSLLTVEDDETYLPKPLLDYVKKVISMNYPDEEIRYVLFNRGWPSAQVEAAIRLCRKYRWNDDLIPPGNK